MPAARSIRTLTEDEKRELRKLYRQTENSDLRTRCQMILLSAEGYNVADIARLTFFEEDSVLYWFDRFEAENLTGLEDRPRSGRSPKSRWPM
jgi:Winged helix-turn helix